MNLTLDFDHQPTGRALRDSGISTVLGNAGDWKERAQQAICTLPKGWTGLFEDVREHVLAQGVGEPHHPHAWGGVAQAAIRRGVLTYTGRWLESQSPNNHSHHYRELFRP